jgi:hypothetical protein
MVKAVTNAMRWASEEVSLCAAAFWDEEADGRYSGYLPGHLEEH